jgi:GTP-binding protein HflX
LRERLTRVERQREVSRKERLRADIPTVALVGYTNAGKTTLFNALAGADLVAKDQLFATLDPTVRRLELAPGTEALLIDTVGFVRDLPHELVAAFRATLTETREAALLLHVIDASDPHHEDRRRQVEAVLAEIGAAEVPCLRVYNKADRAPPDFVRDFDGAEVTKHSVSAVTGEGLEALREEIRTRLAGARVAGEVRLRPDQSRLRARLFGWQAVRAETAEADGGYTLAVDLPVQRWRQLRDEEGLSADSIRQKV